MDLLKAMMANRQAATIVIDPRPSAPERSGKKTKAKKEQQPSSAPGSKAMRHYIIEEKPSKKVVREHIRALIEEECISESESD